MVDKKKMALVSHRSVGKIDRRQRELCQALVDKCGNNSLMHISVWCNKQKIDTCEKTQRTRSFLFVSLAVTVANMFGLNEISIYENGITTFNLWDVDHLVGARASRTTHPRVLKGFASLFSLLLETDFKIKNPFLYKTKSEIFNVIGDAGCGKLIKYTSSCAHTHQQSKAYSHCGRCSQCIDRRFGALASNYNQDDPGEMYHTDLVVGARETSEDRSLLEGYVHTASNMSELDFNRFHKKHSGEMSKIWPFLEGYGGANANQIYDLHARHGKQILEVLSHCFAENTPTLIAGNLPANSLLNLIQPQRLMSDDERSGHKKANGNVWHKSGDKWEVTYEGLTHFINDLDGATYIHELLREPNQYIHVSQLYFVRYPPPAKNIIHPGNSSYPDNLENRDLNASDDPVLDRRAIKEYKDELEEIQKRIDEAEAQNDIGRSEALRKQKDSILNELVASSGAGNRSRQFNNENEKFRIKVQKAISRLINRLENENAPLAVYLKIHIKTGRHCIYLESNPTSLSWSL